MNSAKDKRYKAWCRWLSSKHQRHFDEMVGEFSYLARRVTGAKWGHLCATDFDELLGHAFFGTFEFFNKLDTNRLKDYDHLETTFCWYIKKKLLSAFRGSQMRTFSSKLKPLQPLSLNQQLIEYGEEEWVDMLPAKGDPFEEVEFWANYAPAFEGLSEEQKQAVYLHNFVGHRLDELPSPRGANQKGLERIKKNLEGKPARRYRAPDEKPKEIPLTDDILKIFWQLCAQYPSIYRTSLESGIHQRTLTKILDRSVEYIRAITLLKAVRHLQGLADLKAA